MTQHECVSCGEDRDLCCRGLCGRCRAQARRDGTVDDFGYVKADRLADFTELRRSCSVAVAAARLGVCERTGWRYEADRGRAQLKALLRRERSAA
jgi:hypothetical protein